MGRENVSIDFNELWGGERRFKIEISEVNGPKERVTRDNRVEQDVHTRERSDKG